MRDPARWPEVIGVPPCTGAWTRWNPQWRQIANYPNLLLTIQAPDSLRLSKKAAAPGRDRRGRGRRPCPLRQRHGAALDGRDLDSPPYCAGVDAYRELVREQVREARGKADVDQLGATSRGFSTW